MVRYNTDVCSGEGTVSKRRSLSIITTEDAGQLANPIEYRKSGLSLNHIIGCPLDCAYCIRHAFGNYELKQPRALCDDATAVALLTQHRYFRPHATPIQLFNRATDPFLPKVKPHTFEVLRRLDELELRNHVLVITRYRVTADDCAVMNSFRHIRLTLLVTHSGIIDPRIEPIDSEIAAKSLSVAYSSAESFRVVLYWRPIVPGLNDSDEHLAKAKLLSAHAHATVFTGLFYRDQIQDYYRSVGLQEPYSETARRKILPRDTEDRILRFFAVSAGSPLFRKTSCAVSYAHGSPDYNGHYGIRELCDICPASQLDRCAASHKTPSQLELDGLRRWLGHGVIREISNRAVIVEDLGDEERYYIQHQLAHQVHAASQPHLHRQHGRAITGWSQ